MYAARALRADREVVLEAVKQNGEALAYAVEELRADREVVLEAVRQNVAAFPYAAKALCADREVLLVAVSLRVGTRGRQHFSLMKTNGSVCTLEAQDCHEPHAVGTR